MSHLVSHGTLLMSAVILHHAGNLQLSIALSLGVDCPRRIAAIMGTAFSRICLSVCFSAL